MEQTYEIIPSPDSAGGEAIKCLTCGMVSHHPDDVKNLYCGNCHRFFTDEQPRPAAPAKPAPERK